MPIKYRIDLSRNLEHPFSDNKSVFTTELPELAKSVFSLTAPSEGRGVVLSVWSEYAKSYITMDHKGFTTEPETPNIV